MFGDHVCEDIGIPSSWARTKKTAVIGTQTSEIITDHAEIQTTPSFSIEIQTDPDEMGTLLTNETVESTSALTDFLQRAELEINRALEENLKSVAFDAYDVCWSEGEDESGENLVLTNPAIQDHECTAISWNSRGAVVAAGFGRFDHESWCTHTGCISTWNLDRQSFNKNKPDVSIDIPACIMSLQYHPEQPSLLVAGAYNGIVYVIDFNQPNGKEVISQCLFDDVSHTEPVTQVVWKVETDKHGRRSYVIMSASGDGSIVTWALKSGKPNLVMLNRAVVRAGAIPSHARPLAHRPDAPVGVSSLSISTDRTNSYIIGLENGSVLKCSMDAPVVADQSALSVLMAYSYHGGPIYSVCHSPYHRNIFLTCSTDGTLRIFHELQTTPLVSIETDGFMMGAAWVRSAAAIAMTPTSCFTFDLTENRCAPISSIPICDKKSQACSMAWNSKRSRLIAVGDSRGAVTIITLPKKLYTTTALDSPTMERISAEIRE